MPQPDLYGYPVLGRYGLAHGLLAWARCVVWCEEQGARMIAPIWLKPRIGPYLRRERDKREYFKLFTAGPAISGLRRAWLLARTDKIDVHAEPAEAFERRGAPIVVRFHNALTDNEKKSFAQVVGYDALLRSRLLEITRPRHHPPRRDEPFIAIHVRLGDFRATTPSSLGNNMRLPIHWYGDRLTALRKALGTQLPALVFSDGSDDDLRPVLSLDNVSRVEKRESVTDLLDMGQGVAVISSGSGFSLWGAFLGGAPRLCHPGQKIVPAYREPDREIESAFGSTIGAAFIDQVRARFVQPQC